MLGLGLWRQVFSDSDCWRDVVTESLTSQIKYTFPVSALPRLQLSCLFPMLPEGARTAFIGLLCDDVGMVDVHQAAYKVENLCTTFLGSLSRRHCMPQLAGSKSTFARPPVC